MLNKILTRLLSDPDSVEPFELVLSHIMEMTDARSGAIFVSTESGRQLVQLAVVGDDDRSRWLRVIRQSHLFSSLDTPEGPRIVSDATDPDSSVVVQSFSQGISGIGLLLLRVESSEIPVSRKTLESFTEYLSGVIESARCARMKLRSAQSEERAAIARELHDSLAQSISYLKVKVSLLQDTLRKRTDSIPDIEKTLQEVRSTLSTADLQLRELITTFRLTMRGRTFSQALEDSIEEFERRSSIAFDLDNRLKAGRLTVSDEMQLLLILREALCNVVRHSHASLCWVSVRVRDDGAILMRVEDNGIGVQLALQDGEHHHGLIIMQERARALGGTFRIEDRIGGGTRLNVYCPGTDDSGFNAIVD
ncbi:histidine kinase [Methyloceanibacter caenitepidi]|uniref:histidine kinase n=1 Tax=Methyloceanibacter caenitepidi TaxID=1384459 RepID=UPI00155A221B|nr:histidine kinase [Methyloceanibacter caenitepidi]